MTGKSSRHTSHKVLFVEVGDAEQVASVSGAVVFRIAPTHLVLGHEQVAEVVGGVVRPPAARVGPNCKRYATCHQRRGASVEIASAVVRITSPDCGSDSLRGLGPRFAAARTDAIRVTHDAY